MCWLVPHASKPLVREVTWLGRCGRITLTSPSTPSGPNARAMSIIGVHVPHGELINEALHDIVSLVKNRPPLSEWMVIGDWNVDQMFSTDSEQHGDALATSRRASLTSFVDALNARLLLAEAVQVGRAGRWVEETSFGPYTRCPPDDSEAARPSCLDYAITSQTLKCRDRKSVV